MRFTIEPGQLEAPPKTATRSGDQLTSKRFLQALRRRWYVVVLILAFAAAGMAALPKDTGVYWSRVTVVFLAPPGSKIASNPLAVSDETLVHFAAVVERQLNGHSDAIQLSSSSAPLYGAGVRHGFSVTLPNSGGQWRTNFNRPVLNIEVVEETPERNLEVLTDVVREVDALSEQVQVAAGSAPRVMIRTELAPQQPQIIYVGGRYRQATAALLLLGAGLSVASAIMVDNARTPRASASAGRQKSVPE